MACRRATRTSSAKRVWAGVDSTIAVLRAMGAPVASLGDATDALRARKDGARPAPPRARDRRVGRAAAPTSQMHVPSSETGRELRFALTPEGDQPTRWETGAAIVDGSDRGRVRAGAARLHLRLPIGRHHLWVETADGQVHALVLSAPRTCPQPDGRWWGVFAPALRAPRRGRLGGRKLLRAGEVPRMDRRSRRVGGRDAPSVRAVPRRTDGRAEPLLAGQPSLLERDLHRRDTGTRPGRVSPRLARRWRTPPSASRLARLRKNDLTDHPAVAAAKRTRPRPPRATDVRGHATGRSARVRVGTREPPTTRGSARRWSGAGHGGARGPEPSVRARSPGRRSMTTGRATTCSSSGWPPSSCRRPPAARAAAGGLMLDLPIGVNGAGYDVWRERDSFAPDVAAGAPPDAFWSQGQDWGAPPPHPHGTREAGYRYHDEVFRTLFRYAAVARIDHVIGLHRLYWVPRGASAKDGVYVRYRAAGVVRAPVDRRERSPGGRRRRGPRNGARIRSTGDEGSRPPADLRRAARGGQRRPPRAARGVRRRAEHPRHADVGRVLARDRRPAP